MTSRKGTTGCSLKTTKDKVQVILSDSGKVVWEIPRDEAPNFGLFGMGSLFDWVMENHSEEISKAIDGETNEM